LVLTALLLCCSTLSGNAPQNSTNPSTELQATKTPDATSPELTVQPLSTVPDAPTPKTLMSSAAKGELDLAASGEPNVPAIQPPLSTPVKPAITESYETPRQRKIWYGLMVAGHGTAAFDAWTTRRAISGGYGTEGNPLQRPFAHSGAIYATTQVTPLIMDYLGRRMMRSSHSWIRKSWWVPQAASASVSLGAGIHNYSIVP